MGPAGGPGPTAGLWGVRRSRGDGRQIAAPTWSAEATKFAEKPAPGNRSGFIRDIFRRSQTASL